MTEQNPPLVDMMESSPQADIAQLSLVARSILRLGFTLSAIVLAAGIALSIIQGKELAGRTDSFSKVLPAVFRGDPHGVIDLSILLLMATPLATVISLVIGFWKIGDRRYAGISLLVVAILMISVTMSLLR